jgi:hypothetical protein
VIPTAREPVDFPVLPAGGSGTRIDAACFPEIWDPSPCKNPIAAIRFELQNGIHRWYLPGTEMFGRDHGTPAC